MTALNPYVWNNSLVDGSFGITSKIFLDQLTTSGTLLNSLEVPNSSQNGVPSTKDQMVTSFSSKSELALNLSTDGSLRKSAPRASSALRRPTHIAATMAARRF
jgi:hypothetical protein